MKNLLNNYKVNQLDADIYGASKKKLLIMIYDKIINNFNEIIYMIEIGNNIIKLNLVDKTLDLIQIGLISNLNHNINSNISELLKNFYEQSVNDIVFANLNNNKIMFKLISNEYHKLKDVWLLIKEN